MNPRVTLGLGLILAMLAIYIFAVDRPQAQRAEEAKHIVQVQKSDVTAITVQSPKGTVDLARQGSTRWTVIAPVQVPASSFAIGDLLDAVTGLTSQRTLPAAGADLASYGLTKPVAQVVLRVGAGRTVTLAVGGSSPVATGLYARVLPGDSVYLVDSSIKDALSKSVTDLRQKTLADFANSDVDKVRIVTATGTIIVDRLAADRWQIEGPRPWPADDFKVTDLFFPLTSSDAKAFHDGVADPATYGLDHPSVTVELTMKGRTDPVRFLFTQRGKIAYAMVAGGKTVYELDPSLIGKMSPDPVALVSMRVLPYNAQDLTAVEWRRTAARLNSTGRVPASPGAG